MVLSPSQFLRERERDIFRFFSGIWRTGSGDATWMLSLVGTRKNSARSFLDSNARACARVFLSRESLENFFFVFCMVGASNPPHRPFLLASKPNLSRPSAQPTLLYYLYIHLSQLGQSDLKEWFLLVRLGNNWAPTWAFGFLVEMVSNPIEYSIKWSWLVVTWTSPN